MNGFALGLVLAVLVLVLGVLVTTIPARWNAWLAEKPARAHKLAKRGLLGFVFDEVGGYVHDTAMSQWIAPELISKSAGTWTPTFSTNKVFHRRSASDAAFNLFVPIKIPSNSVAQKGSYLQSIDFFYNITAADADDFATVTLAKQTVSSVGAHTAAAVTTTIDAGHDTAAERKAQGEHKMTVSLSTPAWIDNDEAYVLYMVVDAAASTVVDIVGARANFTLRI